MSVYSERRPYKDYVSICDIWYYRCFFLGDNMLAKEDLLVCKTPPNIRDVSLQLYKEFAETYLKNDGSGRNTLNSNDFKIPAFLSGLVW